MLPCYVAAPLQQGLEQAAARSDDRTIESCARAVESLADAESRAARNLNLKFVCAGMISDLATAFQVGVPVDERA